MAYWHRGVEIVGLPLLHENIPLFGCAAERCWRNALKMLDML